VHPGIDGDRQLGGRSTLRHGSTILPWWEDLQLRGVPRGAPTAACRRPPT
jgi:hypothetical protein